MSPVGSAIIPVNSVTFKSAVGAILITAKGIYHRQPTVPLANVPLFHRCLKKLDSGNIKIGFALALKSEYDNPAALYCCTNAGRPLSLSPTLVVKSSPQISLGSGVASVYDIGILSVSPLEFIPLLFTE